MKTFFRIAAAAALFAAMTACDAFHSLTKSRLKTAQGSPYELIVVCPQQEWTGELGDTLRSILTAPVPYLNQTEPLFDVLRVLPSGFENLVTRHRNVLQVLVDAEVEEPAAAVQYDLYAQPQIVVTLQGPTQQSLVDYLGAHRGELLYVLEKAERDRTIDFGRKFPDKFLTGLVKEQFGVDFSVPQGYKLRAKDDDFLWISYEFPQASQGFFIYSYPYTGKQALTVEALTEARNRFAARIPGPSEGSYMITADVYEPDLRTFRQGEGSFDVCACNPPYFTAGPQSQNAAHALARHENTCTLDDVCACAFRLLKDGGRLALCHRPERLAEVLDVLRAHRLEPKRLAFVKNRADAAPWLFLVEAQKNRKTGLRVEPDVLISAGAALYGR